MYLKDQKFSLWCDFIEKSFLEDEFLRLIANDEVNGATSNPAIFKNSILNSPAYKAQKEELKHLDAKKIYENIAIDDITKAGEILLKQYMAADDGFISIEVDPTLCDDTHGTVEEGRRIFKQIGLPNVMIKIPATEAGYEAMRTLFSEGININATLIFSPYQAQRCVEAFKDGKKECKDGNPQAVVSVFVSRFDTKVKKRNKDGLTLGIVNAMRVYEKIEEYKLPFVRTLFASTGVKDNSMAKDFYMEKLLLPNSVNTAPLETLECFLKNGLKQIQTPLSKEEIDGYFQQLRDRKSVV